MSLKKTIELYDETVQKEAKVDPKDDSVLNEAVRHGFSEIRAQITELEARAIDHKVRIEMLNKNVNTLSSFVGALWLISGLFIGMLLFHLFGKV